MLLFVSYIFVVKVLLEDAISPPLIYKIDKVIGKEEKETGGGGCFSLASNEVFATNICEAAIYSIQPRFQFYD